MEQSNNPLRPIVSKDTVSEQAFNVLRDLIEEGKFSPGQKLPSENDLASQLNISRITLRTALTKLELMGYVDRKRGIGTFVVGVTKKPLETGIERLVSITQVMLERGHQPGTKEINIYGEIADENIAKELRISVGDPITLIDRVRTMDGLPIMFDRSVFPVNVIPQNLTCNVIGESLFNYVEDTLHLTITHAVAHLVPYLADEFLAEKLCVPKGTLLLRLIQTNYIKGSEAPVWQSTISSPENKFSWYIVRTR
jgi:GntR family transcriptional regulator